eukprot:scaffold266804_cov26-Prasinocladus_malaysianus.AAC.1
MVACKGCLFGDVLFTATTLSFCHISQVMDNTYEHFVYGGREHFCPSGPHVVNIFSFSKAYGMMGWRMGYLTYSASAGMVGPQTTK